MAGYRGKKRYHVSEEKFLMNYEESYWPRQRAKEFVHQPKPNTQALLKTLVPRESQGEYLMKKAKLRWFEDEEGVKHLNERLEFLTGYLELDGEGVRRVILGDYRLIEKDAFDVETDFKPICRFLRKELELTNKDVGQMLVRCPSMFRGYIHEMKRVIKYMHLLGLPFYQLQKVVVTVPHVLHTDIDVKRPKTLTIIRTVCPNNAYLKTVKHPWCRKKEGKHQKD